MASQKSPTHGVVAFFRDLDIQHVCLHPRKNTPPSGTKFLLSHLDFTRTPEDNDDEG